MKNHLSKAITEYKKINKNIHINHILLTDNYADLCMNFFNDKYNTLITQSIAQQSCYVYVESEDIFVDWLNKE